METLMKNFFLLFFTAMVIYGFIGLCYFVSVGTVKFIPSLTIIAALLATFTYVLLWLLDFLDNRVTNGNKYLNATYALCVFIVLYFVFAV